MKSSAFQRSVITACLLAAGVPAGNPAVAETVRVQIKSLAFIPAEISVRDGDTLELTNDDFVVHTATARNGAWDVMLPPHATRHVDIKGSGTVEYYCRFHPNMKGTITIKSE